MIHIEKILLPFRSEISKAGLIDTFMTECNQEYYLNFWNKDCNILGDTVRSQLANYNITLGQKFGVQGASIYEAILNNNNTVYEISDEDIFSIPNHLIKPFLENCVVLIHDYNEGGSFICGKENILLWIKNLKFTPRRIYLHTSNYNFKDTDLQNVFVLPYADMFAIYTACSLPHLLTDPNQRQQHLDKLDVYRSNHNYQYHAMVYNRKPRYFRVALLSRLEELGILKNCLWTLAWNKDEDIIEKDWTKSPNVVRHQQRVLSNSTTAIDNFLNAYLDELPKILNNTPADISGSRYISLDWGRTIKWGTAVEVFNYASSEYPNPQGFLSEKTWRYFLTGIPPIVISAGGACSALKALGMQIVDLIDDTSEGQPRVDAVANFLAKDFYKNQFDHKLLKEMSLRNFELVTDKNFLSSLVTNGLKDINLN